MTPSVRVFSPAMQVVEQKPRRKPPRVRALPFVGSMFSLLGDSLGFLTRISRDHGDVVEFRIPGQRIILFNHPDAIEQVLVAEKDRFIKDKLTRELGLMLGNGLLLSEGSFWRKQRMLIPQARILPVRRRTAHLHRKCVRDDGSGPHPRHAGAPTPVRAPGRRAAFGRAVGHAATEKRNPPFVRFAVVS